MQSYQPRDEIPLPRSFLPLVATEELFSRHSHHYWLPKSLESAFCLDALDLALACRYTPVIILLNREACQLPGSGHPSWMVPRPWTWAISPGGTVTPDIEGPKLRPCVNVLQFAA